MKREILALKLVAVMALLVLATPSCEKNQVNSGEWALARERIEVTQALKLADYRLKQIDAGGVEELAVAKQILLELGSRTRELNQRNALLAAEVQEMEIRNDEFVKGAIRNQRSRVIGQEFETFVMKDGRVLLNVLIAGVEDGGVDVRHEHGAARLRYSDLSPEQHVLFGLVEDLAIASERLERRDSLAYERWIDSELKLLREKEEAANIVKASERIRPSPSYVANWSSNAPTRALAQPATRVGGSRWYGYRSYRPSYSYVHCYPTASRYRSSFTSIISNGRCSATLPVVAPRVAVPRANFTQSCRIPSNP